MINKRNIGAVVVFVLACGGLFQSLPAQARGKLKMAEFRQISLLSEAYARQDCRRLIGAAERRYRIPAQLLSAIALTESGRWMADRGAIVAWPWTVYAEGEGHFFKNRAAAEAAVRALSKRGVRNIDVGCMQVNLQYHGDAFDSPDDALSPAGNIDYAARLLRRLYIQHRSWLQAVAYYHSATKSVNIHYRRKVIRIWHKERRWAINERRRLVQAAYDSRRAARPYRKARNSVRIK